jgi:uncharacterized protein YndB with AHSA1/START domain
MTEPLITVDTTVNADASAVWDTLTQKKSAMFLGADVDTDWREGSPMKLSGEFHGKAFHDHGEIRASEPMRHLAFTHFSGNQETNGNLVDIRLEPNGGTTKVVLSQSPLSGQRPDSEKIGEFRKNWEMMLDALKQEAEHKSVTPA